MDLEDWFNVWFCAWLATLFVIWLGANLVGVMMENQHVVRLLQAEREENEEFRASTTYNFFYVLLYSDDTAAIEWV